MESSKRNVYFVLTMADFVLVWPYLFTLPSATLAASFIIFEFSEFDYSWLYPTYFSNSVCIMDILVSAGILFYKWVRYISVPITFLWMLLTWFSNTMNLSMFTPRDFYGSAKS